MKTNIKRSVLTSLCLVFIMLLAACAPAGTPAPTQAPTQPPASKPANPELILATTTSTRDSGLLDVLLPEFQKQTGYNVKMVAVGSGQALQMGADCNADVLLVHSPAAEKALMEKGGGKERSLIMHNDFIIVGPKDDPARIKGTAKAADAFKKISEAKAVFASRGDKSGTNTAELNLWKAAKIEPKGDGYLSTGQGMGETLKIASEKNGYTLTDRATYLAQKANLALDILVEGDPSLLNIYHVITVNPEKCAKVNAEGANAFAKFMVAAETQKMIGDFGKDKFGQSLFFPDAGKQDSDLTGK